jgi:hypothetical protein
VVLSPLPLGSNREWSWTLCALLASLLAILWVLKGIWRPVEIGRFAHPVFVALFVLACGWIVIQTVGWVPASWRHPLWAQAAQVLGTDFNGSISVASEDGWTALMRLLSYALVFFLAFQLGSARSRAHAFLGWIFTAGIVYAVLGLVDYWGIYSPVRRCPVLPEDGPVGRSALRPASGPRGPYRKILAAGLAAADRHTADRRSIDVDPLPRRILLNRSRAGGYAVPARYAHSAQQHPCENHRIGRGRRGLDRVLHDQ